MFRFYVQLQGPAKIWIASIVLVAVGLVIFFGVPTIADKSRLDIEIALNLIHILGFIFFGLGAIPLAMMLIGLFIRANNPQNYDTWVWWVNFLGGLLGALAFAGTAALIFPVFFFAFLTRPNAFFPANDANAANILLIAALFSFIGIICLITIFFIARGSLRNKREKLEWTYQKEI